MLAEPTQAPRRTLAWGGAGIVLATLVPVAWEGSSAFRRPGLPGLSFAWPQLAMAVSAVVLLGACCILAFGIGAESGIAGASVVGKVALVVFPAATVAGFALSFSTPSLMATLPESAYDGSGQPDQQVLLAGARVLEGIAGASLVGLIVASVFVARAGVVRGVARWSLAALALATVAVDLAQHTPTDAAFSVFRWGAVAVPLIQLAVGVLYVVQASGKRVSGGARSVVGAA